MNDDDRVEHLLLARREGGAPPTSIRADELRCSRCKGWKPDEEFYRQANPLRRGRHGTCKPCHVEEKRELRRRRAAGGKPKLRHWTSEEIVEAIRLWAVTYGEPPRYGDWRSGRRGSPEQRARRDRLKGRIPTTTTVEKRFGSFNAAVRAAGHEPRSQGWPG